MLRINCVPPAELPNEQLIKEYAAIPRVLHAVRKVVESGKTPEKADIPSVYTLGPDHLKFFYPRLRYVRDRQVSIFEELKKRNLDGGRVAPKPKRTLRGIPKEWCGDWVPDDYAQAINRARMGSSRAEK